MKKTVLIILLLSIAIVTKAQNTEKCRNIVQIAINSVNTQSTSVLTKHLADNFEIANQKGEIAKIVLKQLIKQLNDTIISYKETEKLTNDSILTLKYQLTYKKIGEKQAIFSFNKENKITHLELLKIMVKRMEKSERKIIKPNNNVLTVPFRTIGKLIGVNVILNGKERLFLFDSGSPSIIVNSKYLTKNDTIKYRTISDSKGINGNISNMDIENIDNLNFAGIELNNQKIITIDLSHLEESLDEKIYGLIGYEIFKDYDLLFDYQKRELLLIKPEYFNQYKKDSLNKNKITILPIELQKHIPVIKATIGKTEYTFGIDCGAETNLINEKLFLPLKKHLKKIKKDTLNGADNNRKEVLKGIVKKTKIGNIKFKNMTTVFSDISHLNNAYKVKIDGLLGYEFLSKKKILISYKRKELIFIE